MKHASILITGANGGIGNGIARYFLEHDADCFVYLGIRSNRDVVDQTLSEFPNRCAAIMLDVVQEHDWSNAMQAIEQDGRYVAILVNNAGHHEDHLLATMPNEAWTRVIDSNLHATFLGSKAVMNGMMRERFGRIINIASLSAIMAPLGQTNYAAAKAGVVAMTQSLAKEVGRMGITVNALCPGYIETEALKEMDEEQKKATKRGIPMRRFGSPKEVASAVFFLASKDAGYITGASLKIDGGIF